MPWETQRGEIGCQHIAFPRDKKTAWARYYGTATVETNPNLWARDGDPEDNTTVAKRTPPRSSNPGLPAVHSGAVAAAAVAVVSSVLAPLLHVLVVVSLFGSRLAGLLLNPLLFLQPARYDTLFGRLVQPD